MRCISIIFVTTILALSCALGVFFAAGQHPWVDFSVLENYNPGKPSIVYDAHGKEWTRFTLDKREMVCFARIPPHVINAFVAAEDWNFFNHTGISYKGIIRSVLVNIWARRKAQGASTITQQLAKLLFFDSKKNYVRKIKEQLLAIIIEQQFSKEHILEIYLNHVCFGCAIYGIEAASQRFWAKGSDQLTIAQAALLAGIVCCPQKYCPLLHPAQARERRNTILRSMRHLGFISQQEYLEATQEPVVVVQQDAGCKAPHLKETLRGVLEDLLGKEKLYAGGFKIQTTLDLSLQEIAERVFTQHLQRLQKTIDPAIDGGLVLLDRSGCVRALVGGYDFAKSHYNRALSAKRQIGSTIKPLIIYAAALEQGMHLTDVEIDEPFELQGPPVWAPRNYNRKFEGPMTLARALSVSNNIIAIKTLLKIEPSRIVRLAHDYGLAINNVYPSLALGCVDDTLLQATTMMNTLVHNGEYKKPHYLLWIKNEWDTKIWKHQPMKKQIIDPLISGQIAQALTLSMQRRKKKMADGWPACQTLGKTGTTNDARTCWFTGATPDYTMSVYIGCDDNRPLGTNVYATKTAFPIWLDIMKQLPQQTLSFSFDPRLQERLINQFTGLPTSTNDPDAIPLMLAVS